MFLKSTNEKLRLIEILLLLSFFLALHHRVGAWQKCDQDILITIEREVCFGDCPAYSAQIYSDGTVVYVGKHNVKVIGERRFKISWERIQALIKEFQQINYFSLKDKYQVDENGMSVTDQPTTTTSICLEGKKKRVVNYYCAPKQLEQLEDKIDRLQGFISFLVRFEPNTIIVRRAEQVLAADALPRCLLCM